MPDTDGASERYFDIVELARIVRSSVIIDQHFSVRPAAPADVPVILNLVQELARYAREPEAVVATESDLRTALFGEDRAAFCHLTDLDGEVTGFAVWFLTFSTWTGKGGVHLEDLFVRPEHRRCGHGLALLRELARLCVARGYPRLEWEVLDWNESALAFYHSIGAVDLKGWTKQRIAGGVLLSTTGQS